MKLLYTVIYLILCPFLINAQDFTIPLWDGEIPNYIDSGVEEITTNENRIILIREIQDPDIAVYLPANNNGTGEAVIICPGGGYWVLAYDWEGRDIARALNAKGIAAIVLKYRLPTSTKNYVIRHQSPLLDAQRAMRMVRFNAKKWRIDKNKIGIMGFSAGGHLAATLSTHYDSGDTTSKDSISQMSCRPDYTVLVYSLVSFSSEFKQNDLATALIGDNPSTELLNYYSSELHVTEDTPPAIMIHATDDEAVPIRQSIIYFEALQKHNVLTEMHIYPYGGHGFSLATGKSYLSTWMDRCTEWIHYLSDKQ